MALVMISLVVAIACITMACVVIKHELHTWKNFGSITTILFTVIENVALIHDATELAQAWSLMEEFTVHNSFT